MLHIRISRREKTIRPQQRNAREEIIVQQPLRPAGVQPLGLAQQIGRPLRGRNAQQVVREEEEPDCVDVLRDDFQRRFRLGARDQCVDSCAVPARNDLEFRPAEAIESITGRIMQRIGRRPIERGGAAENRNVLADRRQHRHVAGCFGGLRHGSTSRGIVVAPRAAGAPNSRTSSLARHRSSPSRAVRCAANAQHRRAWL